MTAPLTKDEMKNRILEKLSVRMGVTNPVEASLTQLYQALVHVLHDVLYEKRQRFWASNLSSGKKQAYYLSMEFLLGRSLKNSLFNLGLETQTEQALAELDASLDQVFECEPDAGLGNGGLGRLAACYLDGLATDGFLATGYCILYEFGIFQQQITDGWQAEVPYQWLPGGEVWLTTKPGYEVEIRFGGEVHDYWENGRHLIQYRNYNSVLAVPYDMHITGYNSEGVTLLRLWRAKTISGMDMDSFNRGDYAGAFQQTSYGEAISKVLYPNDNHVEGKTLRLRQQYFLCAASIADICRRHLSVYGTLDNFAEKNAIHINDTHPTLAIPEFMRFLLDDCGYGWDEAWNIVQKTFAYTNHTVMKEALECWDESLLKTLLPRIYSIITEIDNRHRRSLYEDQHLNTDTVERMAVLGGGQVRMANLAVLGSHSVNGVSGLHSEIVKHEVFRDFYDIEPDKFTNVTNGIASRRWLLQANPSLTKLIRDAIGEDFADDMFNLAKLKDFADDKAFLDKLAASKRLNKERLCKHIKDRMNIALDPDSIFDAQLKRMHEYKRQQLNALEIIATYQYLKEHRDADFVPHTYLFGAKAAPGYFMAKQIIKLICSISEKIEKDPFLREKMRVVFVEEYNVTYSEILMPASDISQQISLAGTEASGTGNMKLMLNGAITLGTLDGANVEIRNAVGDDNILIFGMRTEEVEALRRDGYNPRKLYESSPIIKHAVDALKTDFDIEFPNIHDMLITTDYYMTLQDFDAYHQACAKAMKLYQDKYTWQRMALRNIAESGVFCADRAVREYADKIWGLQR